MNYLKHTFWLLPTLIMGLSLSSCFYSDSQSYANHGKKVKRSDFVLPKLNSDDSNNNNNDDDAEDEHFKNMEEIPPINSDNTEEYPDNIAQEDSDPDSPPPLPINITTGSSVTFGFVMASYFSKRLNLSFYYPNGWSVILKKSLCSIIKDRKDPTSQQIHIINMSYKKAVSTKTAVKQLILYLKKTKSNFKVKHSGKISSKMRAITFSAKPQGTDISGFAFITVVKKRVVYAIVFGKTGTFTNFNAPMTLGYIIQSFKMGPQPQTPIITKNQLSLKNSKTSKKKHYHMGINNFWKTLKNLKI